MNFNQINTKQLFIFLCILLIIFPELLFSQCLLREEIRSIRDGIELLNHIPKWLKKNQLLVDGYYEIGKQCFILYAENHNAQLLNHSLKYVAYSSENLSVQDSVYHECCQLNYFLSFLYRFNNACVNKGFNPYEYLNQFNIECKTKKIDIDYKFLVNLIHMMSRYYQTEKILKENLSPQAFDKMDTVLTSIDQLGIENASEMRMAYQSWRRYFSYLNRAIQEHKEKKCHLLEMSLNTLHLAQKKLSFAKDDRNVCIDYVNCRFNSCEIMVSKQLSRMDIQHLNNANIRKIWQKHLNLAIPLCNKKTDDLVKLINIYANQAKMGMEQMLKQSRKQIQTRD